MCVYSYHEWDLSTWQCRLEHDETEVSPFLLFGVVISLDLIKQRKANSHNYPLLSAIDASIILALIGRHGLSPLNPTLIWYCRVSQTLNVVVSDVCTVSFVCWSNHATAALVMFRFLLDHAHTKLYSLCCVVLSSE